MLNLKKQYFLIFIVVPVILFAFGCSTLPRDKVKTEFTRRMLVTAYDADQKSTGWKYKYGCCLLPPVYAYGPQEGKRKKVGITSSGTKAKKGTIAADISRYPYGTKMYVSGYGWGEVQDVGSAIKGDHIDIFFPDINDAKAWGRKYLDIRIIKP
jgi:3D (Asp-Asp-Asp) domain-containing protein